ncbi:unnamed protein product [Mytilus coruscus]|uniref:Uncharacterized protein n=1 Tax=Mytilus coruscus TaxID=42192 RepID=A0A6J8CAP8_MYTCO|nr:unnamed protein product [Mytilus coruscus]
MYLVQFYNLTKYDKRSQGIFCFVEDATNAFPSTEIITYTAIKDKIDSVSQAGQTTIFNQNDSIICATAINTYGRTTQTVNYGIIICNCVLFILVLSVWAVLWLMRHRSRKQVSMRTSEETSSREVPRMSNYDTISLNTIPHPIHVTNETYSAVWV